MSCQSACSTAVTSHRASANSATAAARLGEFTLEATQTKVWERGGEKKNEAIDADENQAKKFYNKDKEALKNDGAETECSFFFCFFFSSKICKKAGTWLSHSYFFAKPFNITSLWRTKVMLLFDAGNRIWPFWAKWYQSGCQFYFKPPEFT